MGPLGVQEMMLIFVLALLLFGPKKLPELGRMLGKGIAEFRRAKNELKSTFETHLHELERETREDNYPKSSATDYSSYSSTQYPYPYDEYDHYEPGESSSSASHNGVTDSAETVSHHSSDAGNTPVQDSETHGDHSSAQNGAVSGTVPRSNGVQPVQPVSVATQEEHSA
jgi:TatA/E family protein of Tat protein translocase